MSKYLDRAKELRADPNIHYNCCQAVVMPFADDAGLTEEQAFRLCVNFAAGMRRGSACGAITGGLMVLGLFGKNDPKIISEYYAKFRANHDNMLDCKDLLAANAKAGLPKKPHCDGMVFEAVEVVDEILHGQLEA